MRDDRFERPAVQRQERAILLAPAEPRRGEGEGRGRGQSRSSRRARSGASASRRRRRRTDRRSPARRPACRAGPRSRRAPPRSATARRASRRRAARRARDGAAADDERRLRDERAARQEKGRRSRPRRGRRSRATRSSLMEQPPEAASPAHSRRNVRSERAGAPSRRRSRTWTPSCRSPARPRIRRPRRSRSAIGGFGGPEGLAAFLAAERIDAVVDATHPFAARMSANAVAACARDRDAARRLHPPAVGAAGRRPLDRGRDDRGSGRGARSASARPCS